MINIEDMARLWTKLRLLEMVNGKLHQIKYERFFSLRHLLLSLHLHRNQPSMNKSMFYLLILFLSLLMLLYIYSLGSPSKALISLDLNRPNLVRLEPLRSHEEPIIFSKFHYLNVTRAVGRPSISFPSTHALISVAVGECHRLLGR